MTERLIAGRPGLQPERTELSWGRTALVVAIDGGLLLLREGAPPDLLSILAGSFALALSTMMMLTGFRRTRLLRLRPLPGDLAPRQEVLLTGVSVALLGAITLLMIVAR